MVATHGFFLRLLVARVALGVHLTGEIASSFNFGVPENTGLTVLRRRAWRDGTTHWRVWIYNDHAHLADE